MALFLFRVLPSGSMQDNISMPCGWMVSKTAYGKFAEARRRKIHLVVALVEVAFEAKGDEGHLALTQNLPTEIVAGCQRVAEPLLAGNTGVHDAQAVATRADAAQVVVMLVVETLETLSEEAEVIVTTALLANLGEPTTMTAGPGEELKRLAAA